MAKNLKEQFKRIGGQRLNESPLGELPSSKLMKMKSNPLTELEDTSTKEGQWGEFDYKYYSEQIEAAIEAVEAVEEELVRELQGRAEDDTFYNQIAVEQAENQVRRYINGAMKQLEGIQKMLERAENRKDFDN